MTTETRGAPATGGARHRARRCLVQALYQWLLTGQRPDEIAEQFRTDNALSGADAEYFETAWTGVTRHVERTESALAPFLDRGLGELDPVERSVLRLGAWELLEQDSIPTAVVINEAVELARTFGGTDGHSFVNAVLDSAARAWRGTGAEA